MPNQHTPSIPADVRFWRFVTKLDDGCWIFTGSRVEGYGKLQVGAKTIRAHRFAYEMLKGPIPKGLTLDHLCRVRACVNPDHLEPVTVRENTLRGFSQSALNARKVACYKGHIFDEANTYMFRGLRGCRACRAAYSKERRSKVIHDD